MIDELVFKKAKKGDSESFYKLLEPIKEKLYKAAFIYFNNEEDTMDALQDSIIKAINSIDTLKNSQAFNSWICKILINTCKNNYNKSKKVTSININEFENKFTYEDKNVDENYDLYSALEKLSDREKELIVMRYLEDMTLKDISLKKEIPLGTVKSGINRSLKKLKIILGGA